MTMTFKEKYEIAICEAIRRYGKISRGQHYGFFERDESAYAELRVEGELDSYGSMRYSHLSLSTAVCSQCDSKMKVEGSRAVTTSVWAGSFVDSELVEHSHGTLMCEADESHKQYVVMVESTMGDMIDYLDEIWEELGF